MSNSDHAIYFFIKELARADAKALSALAPQGIWHFVIVVGREVGTALWTIQL
jgi:hypothetical protein